MKNTLRALILVPLFAVTSLYAQQVISQAPDGAGWKFTLVVTNTSANEGGATITFYQDTDATGDTAPWSPPLDGPITALSMAPGSSVFIHSAGTAPTLTQGWAKVEGTLGVEAYIIYTYSPTGKPSSDATAPAVSAGTRALVPFDNTASNTASLGTEIAVVNPNPTSEMISVTFRTSANVITEGTPISLPANGQMAFVLPTQFTSTAGAAGLAEFYSSGTFTIIALRSNTSPSGIFSFTSAPVYPTTGAPIIPTSGGGGGGGGGGGVPTGDITFAGFSIGKTTSSVGVSETVGGDFGAYTPAAWDPPYEGTKVGPYCNVWSINIAGGVNPTAAGVYLDAGKSLSLKGPSLPAADGTLPEMNVTSFGPAYTLRLPTGTLVDGGTYTLTGTGGTQVEGFSVSATLPDSFGTNLDTISVINRSQPLTVSWTGTGFQGVSIGVTAITLSALNVLSCGVPASLNSYALPTAALSLLPAIPLGAAGFGALTVSTSPGIPGPLSATAGQPTSLTPNLVQGGKIEYGSFTPQYSVVKNLAIQ
jgi:hypothetical protein